LFDRTFPTGASVSVQPVLTPDNYMDVVPGAPPRNSFAEQQYIALIETIQILLDTRFGTRAR